jgi:hypothetical protein
LVGTLLRERKLAKPFEIAIETSGVFYLVMPTDRKMRTSADVFCTWLRREAITSPE